MKIYMKDNDEKIVEIEEKSSDFELKFSEEEIEKIKVLLENHDKIVGLLEKYDEIIKLLEEKEEKEEVKDEKETLTKKYNDGFESVVSKEIKTKYDSTDSDTISVEEAWIKRYGGK